MLHINYNIDYYDVHWIVCDCDYTRHNACHHYISTRVLVKIIIIHASRIRDFDKYLCSRLRYNSIMGQFSVTDYTHYQFHEGLEIDKKKEQNKTKQSYLRFLADNKNKINIKKLCFIRYYIFGIVHIAFGSYLVPAPETNNHLTRRLTVVDRSSVFPTFKDIVNLRKIIWK